MYGRYPANQLAMLVGAANGMMVPGGGAFAPQLNTRWPGYAPPGASAGNCGPAIPACPPLDAAMQQQMAAAACYADQAMYQRAARAAALSRSPQIALGISSDTRIGGGGGAGTNGAVLTGASATLSATPTVPLCITDFEVSRVSAPYFHLTSMRASRQDFLADGIGVPADAYSPDGIHPPMEMPQLLPGTQITLVVFNTDGAERQFYGSFSGIAGGGQGPCL
jgi:hypothetical protein